MNIKNLNTKKTNNLMLMYYQPNIFQFLFEIVRGAFQMNKKTQRSMATGPDDIDRIEEYWQNNQQEDNVLWQKRKTDRRKSKSKAKARKNNSRSLPNTLQDDLMEDSDLD